MSQLLSFPFRKTARTLACVGVGFAILQVLNPQLSAQSTFSNEHLNRILHQTFLNLSQSNPPMDAQLRIHESTNAEVALQNYEQGIDRLLDDGHMLLRLRAYFANALGIGDPYRIGATSAASTHNHPMDLFVYGFFNDRPLSEALTADYYAGYAIADFPQYPCDPNDPSPENPDATACYHYYPDKEHHDKLVKRESGNFWRTLEAGGDPMDPEAWTPPRGSLPLVGANGARYFSGYVGMYYYLYQYSSSFNFNWIREILTLNLNLAPSQYFNFDGLLWNGQNGNPLPDEKYQGDPNEPSIQCLSCHGLMNNLRSAFYQVDHIGRYAPQRIHRDLGNKGQYVTDSNSVSEPIDPSTGDVLEQELSFTYHKLTSTGPTIRTPYDLMTSIVAHPRFARSWTERIMTMVFGLSEGYPGANPSVPDHFSQSPEHQQFLTEWTRIFVANDMKMRDTLRAVLKSDAYLTLALEF